MLSTYISNNIISENPQCSYGNDYHGNLIIHRFRIFVQTTLMNTSVPVFVKSHVICWLQWDNVRS